MTKTAWVMARWPGDFVRALLAAMRRLTVVGPMPGGAHRALLCAGLAVLGTMALPAQAQTTILNETFENRAGTIPIRVNTYVGTAPAGVTYTAAPVYLTACNGWVARWNDAHTAPAANTQINDCGGSQLSWANALAIPQALGVLNGQTLAAARNNLALTAYTAAGAYTTTDIEIQSTQAPLTPIPAGGSGRFLAFGIDAAAQNCPPVAASPVFQFYLLNPANVQTAVGAALNVCADPRGSNILVDNRNTGATNFPVRVVRLITGASILYTGGATVGVRMRNIAGTAAGNDGGVDNLRILDVTPTLTKAVAGPRYVGQPMPLTFTITNTSGDNLAKTGWSFTDALPSGVTVAATPGVTNTCGGTVTATAGSGSIAIAIANGNLPAGTAGGTASTCTITVNVVSNTVGVFNNVVNDGDAAVDNITNSVGLNLAVQTVPMEWVVNRLTLTKVSTADTGSFAFSGNNGIADHTIVTTAPGLPGTAGPQQTLTVASTTANTILTETPPAGWAITAVACTGLAAGQTATFAGNGVTIPFAGLSIVSGGRDVACTITNTLSSNLSITKSNTFTAAQPSDLPGDTVAAGANTTYTLVVTNAGPGAVTGAVVRDAPGAGITCPVGNTVTITGDGVPAGSFNIGNLTSTAGITLGTLNAGQSTTLSFTCTVN